MELSALLTPAHLKSFAEKSVAGRSLDREMVTDWRFASQDRDGNHLAKHPNCHDWIGQSG